MQTTSSRLYTHHYDKKNLKVTNYPSIHLKDDFVTTHQPLELVWSI